MQKSIAQANHACPCQKFCQEGTMKEEGQISRDKSLSPPTQLHGDHGDWIWGPQGAECQVNQKYLKL